MKRRLALAPIALLFFYLSYGLFIARFELEVMPTEIEANHPEGFYDYKGVVNVRTTDSTGSGTFNEVIDAAQKENLDFIYVTDLNQTSLRKNLEGYYGNTLALVGGEYSYFDARLLNINASDSSMPSGMGSLQTHFADLLSQGSRDPLDGMLFLVHPLKPGFRWAGEYPAGLNGIEVINLRSIWRKSWLTDTASFVWTVLLYPFNAEVSFLRLFSQPLEEVALWDQLSQQQNMIGLAGTAAEARIKWFGSSVNHPSYEQLFRVVSNHLLLSSELTGSVEKDRNKINTALRNGQFYFSVDMLANPKGFNAFLKNPKGELLPLGAKVPWSQGLELNIQLPQKPLVPFETVIYRNGENMLTSNSKITRYQIQSSGNYRAIVRFIPTFPLPDGKKWVPWIFTNHFYVK